MFANTLTLTVAGVAKVLRRINQDNYGSEYRYEGATEAISMKIRHTNDSVDGDAKVMKRHNVFIEHITFPTPTTSLKKSTFTYTSRGASDQDPTLAVDLAKAANVWLASGTVIADLGVGDN